MSDIILDDRIESSETAATALKNDGNALLAAHKYSSAAEKYSAAIEYHPSSILYSNRAQALIKLESYGLAIQDANESIRYFLTGTQMKCSYHVRVGTVKLMTQI